MGKVKVLVLILCMSFSVLSFASVEIYGSLGGLMLFRGGVTLDFGSFYASIGMGYIPRLSMSMGEVYTAEVRLGGQVNYAGLKNTILVPFTFDLSVEIGAIAETYFYSARMGYNLTGGTECLAEIFPFRSFHGGLAVGLVFPVFSFTHQGEDFSFSFVTIPTPPYILFMPEMGVVVSF